MQNALPIKFLNPTAAKGAAIATKKEEFVPVATPAKPKNSLEAGLEILKKLYGETTVKKLNLDRLFEKCTEHTLQSDAITEGPFQKIYAAQINALLAAFENVTLSQARSAFLGKTQLTFPKQTKPDVETEIQGLIKKSIGLLTLPNQEDVVAYFAYLSLWEELFPPMRKILKVEQDKFQLVMDLHHFGSYLEVLLKNGLLVTQKGDHAQIFAFGKKSDSLPPLVCDLVIDRSDSLKDAFVDLKRDIIQFAKSLWKENPSAEIRLTFFSTKTSPTKRYCYSQITEFERDVNGTLTNDLTRLYDTLLEVLDARLKEQKQIKAQRLIDGKRVMVVFTDGKNNVPFWPTSVYDDRPDRLEMQCKAFGDNPPEVFVFAAGDCDKGILQLIATNTAGKFLEGGVKDFPMVMSHIDDMLTPRRLVDFLMEYLKKKRQLL